VTGELKREANGPLSRGKEDLIFDPTGRKKIGLSERKDSGEGNLSLNKIGEKKITKKLES